VFIISSIRLPLTPLLLLVFILSACGGDSKNGDTTPSISLEINSISFIYTDSNSLPEQTVNVNYHGNAVEVGFPPGTPTPNWLIIQDINNQGENLVSVRLIAYGSMLLPGRYETILRLTTSDTGGGASAHQDLPISFTIPHTVDTISHEFNFVDGAIAVSAPKTISVTGQNIQWDVSADQPWIKLNKSSGTGDGTVSVWVDPTGLAFDNYSGNVNVYDPVSGITKSVLVMMTIEDHRLYVPRNGVALTSVPGFSHLSQSLRITDNGGILTNWAAVSDQAWLSLSPANGTTDEMLTLSATTEALSPGIHYATVTIDPDNESTIANNQIIRVGLYISLNAPPALTSIALVMPNVTQSTTPDINVGLASDPIRPYVYVAQNDSSIQVYNSYSGILENTFTVADASLTELVPASDGSFLYVVDRANGAIVPINLDTGTVGAAWYGVPSSMLPIRGSSLPRPNLVYARPNGIPVLLTVGRQMLNVTNGEILTDFRAPKGPSYSQANLAANSCGTSLFIQSSGTNSHSLTRYALTYRNNTPMVVPTHSVSEYGFGFDVSVNEDCTKLYSVNGDGYTSVIAYDELDLSINSYLTFTNQWINNVENDWQGRVFASTNVSFGSDPDTYVFQQNATVPSAVSGAVSEPHTRRLVLSSDGARMITINGYSSLNRTLSFVDVAP
jgi:hypothetical protein